MKKLIGFALATLLLCMTLCSCDLGNGLVSELFGNIRDEYDYVLVEPPVNVYESDVVAIDPIEPWGTVEIETMPPYEIETAYDSVDEYWSEDIVPIDPVEPPMTQIKYFAVYNIDCEYISGCEIFTDLLYTNDDPWVDPPLVTVEQGCDSLTVRGVLGLANAHYARFGYSIDSDGPYYADHYQIDPDPGLKEIIFKQGADYVSEYQVTIPLAELPAGTYEIRLWYANYNNEAELATNVEDWISTFKLEIAQPIED